MLCSRVVKNTGTYTVALVYAKGWDLTTHLVPQTRALKIEKLKAPLFLGPEGAGDINHWCVTGRMYTLACLLLYFIHFYHDSYSVGLNEQALIQV